MNIYVGNLPFNTTDGDLQQAFSAHGAVDRAKVVIDRNTGRSKGFGFVEMSNDDEARAAIQAMNGHDMSGRSLTVNEARPRQ
jgi:cold-inducible RNA-binding protein